MSAEKNGKACVLRTMTDGQAPFSKGTCPIFILCTVYVVSRSTSETGRMVLLGTISLLEARRIV